MQFSSGDTVVDRRVGYSRMLAGNGDYAAAAELMEQTMELCPGWTAGWVMLGEYHQQAGNTQEAVKAFTEAQTRDPEDVFGTALKLAFLGAQEVPDRPPVRYVEELFDEYAGRFEASLIGKLDYSVPGKLAAMIPRPQERGIFRHATDLGCGTGLMGVEIRERCEYLEGYDIAAKMLAKAREKNIYDHLEKADLSTDAAQSGLFAAGAGKARADLVVAADVMMYLGALENALSLAALLSQPDAVLAFSVEEHEGDEGYVLKESLRYAHSANYVLAQLQAHGFTPGESLRTTIRTDRGKPVQGMLFIARRSA